MDSKVKHGTVSMYKYGCRCDECKAAKAKEKADYIARKKSGNFTPRKRKQRVKLCMPIVLCMAKDFKIPRTDIAEVFGCEATTITLRLNAFGYKPGKGTNNDSGIKKRSEQYAEAFRKKVREEYGDKFEVLEHNQYRSVFRCNRCGDVFSRTTIKNGIRCRECARREKKKKERQKEEFELERLSIVQICQHCGCEFHARKKQKYCSSKCASRHSYALNHPKVIRVCKTCGKEFESCSSRNIFCSKDCQRNSEETKARAKQYKRYRNNHRHRAHEYGVAYESGLTLEKIEKRDCHVCYLCGGKTDRNDKSFTKDGYQITGAKYPTQDHVIPMARGGGHVSSNVRLAHKHCNELKSDKLLSELQLPFSIPQ